MTRVLLLSADDGAPPVGGRAMLSRTNRMLLEDLLGDRLTKISPPRRSSRRRDAWRGHVDGIDDGFLASLAATIDAHGITQLFIDGSNFGAAAAAVKARAPHVRIITFFHNVEARFFWGSLRTRRSAKALAVLVANFLAERMAVRHSDVLVTLSDRDSAGLRRLYGRGADAVAPIVLEDRAPAAPLSVGASVAPYLLFVGGGFYANIDGVRWFARTVAPRISITVKVVGRGMEALAGEFTALPNVELVGEVDDLAPWYVGAALVVAPILDGSGMKTKVAEAMMFGKHVAGTPEAFSGYADDVVAANACCMNSDEFVTAIERGMSRQRSDYSPLMRQLYERDHSPDSAKRRLSSILTL